MADPQKYDRATAFEMLQKEHGQYASPEQINQELDSYEKANNLGAPVEQTALVAGSSPAPLTGQDKSISDQAANYALLPSTARETVNAITAPPVGSTSLPDVLSAAWNNLSTPEKYAVGGSTAAVGNLAVYGAKKLVDRFLISDKEATPPIDRTRDIPMGDTKPPPPPPPPEGPKLSAVDQQILDRQAINKPVREEYLNRTRGGAPVVVAPVAEPAATINPKLPALFQAPAGVAAPPPAAAPAPVVPVAETITPSNWALGKTEAAPVEAATKTTPEPMAKPVAEAIPAAQAPAEKPAKAPKVQTEEQRISGAKNWFVSHFGGRSDPQANAAYDKLVKEVLNGKPPMMGPSGGVPPEFNQFKDWYEKNLQGPPKPSREALKAAIASVPRGAVAPPSLRPSEIGQGGGGSLIRSLTDPLQLKQ